jgi:RNA polymerase sigma factor (sigma-70 family)
VAGNVEDLSELVKRTQAGDLESYRRVIEILHGSAYSHAFSYLADSDLAQDAVQEAFIHAYYRIGSLRNPAAFSSWFRRVVTTACNRMVRGRSRPTTSLEDARDIASDLPSPEDVIENQQRGREVHSAIQALPDTLRMVTALHYLGGMSQHDIAVYLGIKDGTVKKRLFDARKKLKEEIVKMATRVSGEGLPPEQVSARVIAELVGKPQPLLIKEHPIRQVVDIAKAALPAYEYFESSEIENKGIYPSIEGPYWEMFKRMTYQLDENSVLRAQTSGSTLRAIKRRQPPIRLLTAGRVFRVEEEDAQHLRVFNQMDGICVAAGASGKDLEDTLKKVVSAILPQMEVVFEPEDYGWVDQGVEMKVRQRNGEWVSVAGAGLLKKEMLRDAGHDPAKLEGFAFGVGLERLAALKYGLRSPQELWMPPYVQPSP